jgi:hypothetical protein
MRRIGSRTLQLRLLTWQERTSSSFNYVSAKVFILPREHREQSNPRLRSLLPHSDATRCDLACSTRATARAARRCLAVLGVLNLQATYITSENSQKSSQCLPVVLPCHHISRPCGSYPPSSAKIILNVTLKPCQVRSVTPAIRSKAFPRQHWLCIYALPAVFLGQVCTILSIVHSCPRNRSSRTETLEPDSRRTVSTFFLLRSDRRGLLSH